METTVLILVYGLIVLIFGFKVWLTLLNYNHRNAKIPAEVNDIYNEDEYKKWLSYNMANFKFGMVDAVISIVIFLGLLIFGFFPAIQEVAENTTANEAIQPVVFMGLYFAITFVVGIFTSYYDSFVIEEKFGFNKKTKKVFITDLIKSLLLTIVFGGGLIYGVATLYYVVSSMFFVYTYILLIVIVLFMNLFYVKLIVPIFNKLRPLEESELKTKIEALALSVGYEISRVSVIDASKRSTKLNAYFTGFGKFKQVVLYDTLIEKMSDDEVVAVLAHEIGHSKHKHTIFGLIQTFIMLSIYVGLLVVILEVPSISTAFGFNEMSFGFSLILFTTFLSPIAIPIQMITSYFSRKHEYQADRFAAVNHNKESMESSLKVLAKENFSNLTPHPLYVKLTYSHPPIADRIKAIRKVK